MNQNYIILLDQSDMRFVLFFLILCYQGSSSVVVLSGGFLTINGAVTTTQVDITVNYTANVEWVAIIWSQDQTDADVHVLEVNPTNTANPVNVYDCNLDQNSYIQKDDVQNIQPSITNFKGDLSNGISVAYSRNLFTGDSKDVTLYSNSVIQVCFISSSQKFVGKGFEKGNEKICSYLSLHQAPSYLEDRLVGNYAVTALFGGGNLTAYITQSFDDGSGQPWLFLSVVHKAQGLNPFIGRWIGVTYRDSLQNTDLAVIRYQMLNSLQTVYTEDMYASNSSYAALDVSYSVNQGGNDITKVMGGLDSVSYLVASYKRKFSTGDVNRDNIIIDGNNTFCFIYGNSLAYTSFVQVEKSCLNFNLATNYYSLFRVTSNGGSNDAKKYVAPINNVVVITAFSVNILVSVSILIWLALL